MRVAGVLLGLAMAGFLILVSLFVYMIVTVGP